MYVINYARNLIKHFLIWSFSKKLLEKYLCELWLLQHVGIGTDNFQAWAVYNCFLDKWLIITNCGIFLLSASSCLPYNRDYLAIMI